MSSYIKSTSKQFSLPPVPAGVSRELQVYLKNLSESLESKLGTRGNSLDRNVTLRELSDRGVVDLVDQSSRFTTGDTSKGSVGFNSVGRVRMYTSPMTAALRQSEFKFIHNLNKVPDMIQMTLHCLVDEGTFKKGMVIEAKDSGSLEDVNKGYTILKTSEDIKVFIGQNGWGNTIAVDGGGAFDILGDASHGNNSLHTLNWAFQIKAFVFESGNKTIGENIDVFTEKTQTLANARFDITRE